MNVTPIAEIIVTHWMWTGGPHKGGSF